jgi:transglutaminase-like putative cysteine protease
MPELPTGGAQRFEPLEDGTARVVVDVDHPIAATKEEIADQRYREPSTTADSADPAIKALVAQATKGLGEDATPMERARAIEKFVNGYISSKSLDVGFATASEVCQTKEGDCSEHAVLLAAMLRADGIPSRGVSGLVYVDQFVNQDKVFGYHMWAQGLIDVDGAPRWVDFDAAVYPFDATHIALSTSSLSDDDVINTMVSVADVLNNLSIEVEDVE